MENERTARTDEVRERLEARQGVPQWHPRHTPLEELIACILSQHTSDVNSGRAFERLRATFPRWEEVIEAPTSAVADAIRSGGLADSKAPRIQSVLKEIALKTGEISLDFLDKMPDDAARKYLLSLHGVGPKTAAIVLCFAMGRPVLPVDTHVFRVSWRLGLIEKRIGEAKAHDALQAQIRPEMTYRFHVALITHGRRICKALTPNCPECPLINLCSYYQQEVLGVRC